MCCKCCQYCLESCYWHLIEKRFCYDESIALYEDPEKAAAAPEKNNNMFDNLAFYDSVSVLAGRSVVTIDAPPPADLEAPLERKAAPAAVVRQPQGQAGRRLQWREDRLAALRSGYFSRSAPLICERVIAEEEDLSRSQEVIVVTQEPEEPTAEDRISTTTSPALPQTPPSSPTTAPSLIASPAPSTARAGLTSSKSELLLLNPAVEAKKRSLMERRMSKSLYLRIDQPPKELPVVRQNSMPKFYLDTPQPHQTESCVLPALSTALASPVPPSATAGFVFDLQSVVQMHRELALLERERGQGQGRGQGRGQGAAQLEGQTQGAGQRDERAAASRLLNMRDRIKLRRVKSSLATVFPHAHHM